MTNSNLVVHRIAQEQTHDWLLNKHYAKRIPSITYAFGLYRGAELIGVVTYGKPPSPPLFRGVCGDEWSDAVYELNRLCLLENGKNQASMLVGGSLRLLDKPKIIVSYADTSMSHSGFVYQATNFIYTGLSEKRTEWREIGSNRHSKSICDQTTVQERLAQPEKYHVIERPRKHRYIYFCGTKKQKKQMMADLKYAIHPYPKADLKYYDSSADVSTQMIMF